MGMSIRYPDGRQMRNVNVNNIYIWASWANIPVQQQWRRQVSASNDCYNALAQVVFQVTGAFSYFCPIAVAILLRVREFRAPYPSPLHAMVGGRLAELTIIISLMSREEDTVQLKMSSALSVLNGSS